MNFLNEMTSGDIAHSFMQTYIKVEHEGVWKAGFVQNVSSHHIDVMLSATESALTRIPFDLVDVSQSDLGMMWHAGNLYYFARRAERQYRRGFRSEGLVAYDLKADGRSVLSKPSGSIYHKAAKWFLEGEVRHNNIFSRDFGRKGQVLWFRSVPVGMFNKNILTMYNEVSLPPAISDNFEVVYAKSV